MDQLASLQIAMAAIALHHLLARRTEPSDRCEWLLSLALLNAAALALWSSTHAPTELAGLWLRHALAAVAAVAALRLGLSLHRLQPQLLRRFLAPVSYVAVSLAASLLSPPALAQDDAPPLDTIPVESSSPPKADEQIMLNPVEVRAQRGYILDSASSGTKTDAALMETPVSISAIPRQRFEDQGAQTVQDVLRYSTGTRADAYGFDTRGDWAMLRGSSAMYYLDGLRMLFESYNTVRPDPWTLDSVEILRGPASVLYGQGPSGGIVNLNSKLPQATPEHQLRAEFGSFDRRQYALDSTGSLTADNSLSYRLVALQRDSDTQVDYVKDDRWLISPSLSWAPSHWLRWTVLGRMQKDESGTSVGFLPWEGTVKPNPNGPIPTNRFVSEPDFDRYDMEQSAVTSILELQLGEDWSLRQNLRWSDSSGHYRTLYPNVFVGPAFLFDPIEKRKVLRIASISDTETSTLTLDQQLQGRFRTGPLEHLLLAGYDYARANIDEVYGDLSSNPLQVVLQGRFDLYDPQYGRYIAPQTAQQPRAQLRQSGFYLQDQVRIGEHWIALFGVRHDQATASSGSTDSDDSETSLRAGLLYRFDAGFSPYLSYSESFQPVAGLDQNSQAYKPVRGKSREIGLKYQPPGSASLLTLAAFETHEENRLAPGSNPRFQVQLGEADIRGIEFEALTTLFSRLDLNANYTWLDAKSDQGSGAAAGQRYKSLATIAEHTGSLWARLRFAIAGVPGFSVGGGFRYIGETTDEGREVTVPAIKLFDAMAGWENPHWRLAVNASNLEDDAYVASCLERGDCYYGLRRSVVGTIAYKF